MERPGRNRSASQGLCRAERGPWGRAAVGTTVFGALVLLFSGAVHATTMTIPNDAILGVDALKASPAPASQTEPLNWKQYRIVLTPGTSFEYVPLTSGGPIYQNQAGQRIRASYDVTFGAYDGEDPDVSVEYMLIFTSIRRIPTIPSGGVTCADLVPSLDPSDVYFKPASYEYVPDAGGFTGADIDRIITTHDSTTASRSQVCNANSSVFSSSLVFAPVLGESESTYRFTMEISQTGPINFDPNTGGDPSHIADMKFLVQGYSAVPEPGTALMLFLGLVGLHYRSRLSKRNLS